MSATANLRTVEIGLSGSNMRPGTDTNQVEIHVLSGADEYQSFLHQSGLPLSVAEAEAGKYQFAAARYRRPAGNADLFLLKCANTASGRMEASVLDGTNHFATYLLQNQATPLTAADSLNFEFRAGNLDRSCDARLDPAA